MHTRIAYHEALDIARKAAARPVATELVPLSMAAGRIAAQAVQAPFAVPGFASSAMDGYAVRGSELPSTGERSFRVAAQVLAGDTRTLVLAAGEAAAIMTGAPLPAGADTVVIQEHARRDGDIVWLPAGSPPGANVRDADDDCAEGAPVLAAGTVLTPARLAVLAGFGFERAAVARKPRVAVLATGDELVAAGVPRAFGQRYDSNGVLLAALAAEAGGEIVARERVGDDPSALEQALGQLSAQADIVLTSGGVSAGVADHLPAVLASLGEVLFWKVRMKPGMPVLCARLGGALTFALPGNPVSAAVTFQTLARPALETMLGRTQPSGLRGMARLAMPWSKKHARLEFLRARLRIDDAGGLWALPHPRQGSGTLSVLADSDVLVLLPEGERDYAEGDRVELQALVPRVD